MTMQSEHSTPLWSKTEHLDRPALSAMIEDNYGQLMTHQSTLPAASVELVSSQARSSSI
jgi:hypothetical protein